MTSSHNDRRGGGGLLLGAVAALLMVACCALPILVAGGAIAGVGALLRNPWVIGAGITLAVLALIAISRRRSGGDTATHGCCPPSHTNEPLDPKDEQNRCPWGWPRT